MKKNAGPTPGVFFKDGGLLVHGIGCQVLAAVQIPRPPNIGLVSRFGFESPLATTQTKQTRHDD
jgi:hypothetical protein